MTANGADELSTTVIDAGGRVWHMICYGSLVAAEPNAI